MRARAKYAVIYRHGEKYPVCRMCKFFGVSRSGYYAYTHNLNRPNPNQSIIDQIARQQKRCKNTYGYRRMHLWLDKNGCHRNPKTVLRLMKNKRIACLKYADAGSGSSLDSRFTDMKIC